MSSNDLPRLTWDMSQPFLYDFNDPDSQFVMFDRRLDGCAVLSFSKPMCEESGFATASGRLVPARVCSFTVDGKPMCWLALRLSGLLCEYGQTAEIQISGYQDTEGNVMEPVTLTVKAREKAAPLPRYAEHEKIALEAARDGIVLMKNERDALPLRPGTVNLFGSGMYAFRLSAVGAGKITPRYAVGLMEAARGESAYTLNEELCEYFRWTDAVPPAQLLVRARERSDTAILVLSRPSGENTDNSTCPGQARLTPEEEALLTAARQGFEKLVVILNVGYPMELDSVEKYSVDALLYCGFGGMLGGMALMDVLTGRVNPSGRLTDTWPVRYTDNPVSRNFLRLAVGVRVFPPTVRYGSTPSMKKIFMWGTGILRPFPKLRKAATPLATAFPTRALSGNARSWPLTGIRCVFAFR